MNRRSFLKTVGAGILLVGCPILASATPKYDKGPGSRPSKIILSDDRAVYKSGISRVVWVKRDKDEFLLDVYTRDGYQALAWLSRDIQAGNIVGTPDARLVRQMVWIQSKLVQLGYDQPLILTSGLRMPSTNRSVENAARNSFHLPEDDRRTGVKKRFKALDFEMDGVPSSVLASVALMAKDGGVGFYGNNGHVHTDVGDVRFWRGHKS